MFDQFIVMFDVGQNMLVPVNTYIIAALKKKKKKKVVPSTVSLKMQLMLPKIDHSTVLWYNYG